MTVPLIPGPTSFLSKLGGALSSISETVRANQERKRQRELQDAMMAQQDLSVILGLIEKGSISRDELNSPNTQELFKKAGINLTQPLNVVPSSAETKERRVSGLPEPLQNMLFGIPEAEDLELRRATTAAGVAEAGAARKKAEVTTGALAGVRPGGAAARAVAQVPAEPMAAAAEEAATTGAQATTARSQMISKVYTETLDLLGDPGDETLQKVASYAAVGGLPYLTEQIQSLRITSMELRNDANLLAGALRQMHDTYALATKEWNDGMQLAALGAGVNISDPEQAQKFLTAYEQQFPRPNRQKIETEVLVNYGLTRETFGEASKRVFPKIFGTQPTEGAAQPGTVQSTVVQRVQRMADNIIGAPSKAMAEAFIAGVKAGKATTTEARAVVARLKAAKVAPEIIKIIEDALFPKAPSDTAGQGMKGSVR